jgi:hypothetical protein
MECDANGKESVFVALSPQRRIHEAGVVEAVEPAAVALRGEIEPPYRAVAVRREGTTWAVGAVKLEVLELPADLEGDELTLVVEMNGERTLTVDGRPALMGLESLAEVAGGRFPAYVLQAVRLDADLWEVRIDPL